MSSVKYFDNKKGHMTQKNHCCYLINFVLTETPSVKSVRNKYFAEPKRLRFEPVTEPETGLSLRPLMKSATGVDFTKGFSPDLDLKLGLLS